MPYVEALSQTVKEIFRELSPQSVKDAGQMKGGSVYLFTYAGARRNQRRPLVLCLGPKTTKANKVIIEGVNLNYLNEAQGLVLADMLPIFDSLSTEQITDMLAQKGDYEKYPLEKLYRTYSVEKISQIQFINI